MRTNFLCSIFIAAILSITSCKQADTTDAAPMEAAKPDMAQVKADIESIEKAWAAAQNAKDLDGLMAMYSDDAISMPDGEPMLKGKAAIRAHTEKDFAAAKDAFTSEYTTLDVYGDGEIVTEVGTGVTKDASGAVVREGKYMAVYQKIDGKYLCIREIYNSDKPSK